MPSFTFTFNDDTPVEKPQLWSNKKTISFEDYLELTACVFNWGDSYDAKVSFFLSQIKSSSDLERTGTASARSSHPLSSSTTQTSASHDGNP
jgi:hypothetical protein